MGIPTLSDHFEFPPLENARPDGLLAKGGDLNPERLLMAYRKGIFPWYSEEEILWWSPDPRFVLIPKALQISKSMRSLIRKNHFRFSINENFSGVIHACSATPRPGQEGTWINQDIIQSYTTLHTMGYAHSAEVWQGNTLVGGLYGILMGGIFFGESMFSHVSNASKYAFIHYVQHLQSRGVVLIDCQIHTEHLESLGGAFISRVQFQHVLDLFIPPLRSK